MHVQIDDERVPVPQLSGGRDPLGPKSNGESDGGTGGLWGKSRPTVGGHGLRWIQRVAGEVSKRGRTVMRVDLGTLKVLVLKEQGEW